MNTIFLPFRLKDGQQISQSDHIKIVKEKETHSLTIEKARLEDTGSYSVSITIRDYTCSTFAVSPQVILPRKAVLVRSAVLM